MAPEEKPDYVEKLEKALFEYVEKFGPTDAVRRLYRDPEQNGSVQIDDLPRSDDMEPKE